MAAEIQKHQTPRKYTALSTDTKPILGLVDLDCILYETDTKIMFKWYGASWEILEVRGALGTHNADIHNYVINHHLHQDTAVTTTVAVETSANGYQIEVVDATSFAVNDYITINTTSVESTHPKILAIVTNTLTLDRRLDNIHVIGDEVEKVIIDMAATGQIGTLASHQIYSVGPPAGEVWHITRLIYTMIHGSAGDLGLFGNLSALTNGVLLRTYVNGTWRTFTNWKINADIKLDFFSRI